jgi:predicted lipase
MNFRRATALASVLALAGANYNQDIAFRAMYYSGAAYCDKGTLDSWSCGEPCSQLSGFQQMTKVENEVLDTFGLVGYNSRDDEIIIAFRGTNGADFMNWLTNLIYYRVQYEDVPNTQVHSGFYTAYSAVSYVVMKAAKALIAQYPNAAILITGHSLGGALATFAALDLKRHVSFSNPINFYTFGSPRMGNQAFTDYVIKMFPEGGYKRVTHYTDVVVQTPPRQMGFNHAGNEIWYYNDAFDGKYKVC